MKKKTKTKPWGLRGGHEPETNAMVVWPGTDRERRARMERFSMNAGESFHNLSAGGGGWGDPLDRPIESVRDDVLDEYVSAEQADRVFGVRVDADGTPTPTMARLDRPAP